MLDEIEVLLVCFWMENFECSFVDYEILTFRASGEQLIWMADLLL